MAIIISLLLPVITLFQHKDHVSVPDGTKYPTGCPSIKPINVNKDKYAGIRYVVMNTENFQFICMRFNHTKTTDLTYTINTTALNLPDKTPYKTVLHVEFRKSLSKPKVDYIQITSGFPQLLSLYVLATDFKTYLVEYSCTEGKDGGNVTEMVVVESYGVPYDKNKINQVLKKNKLTHLKLVDSRPKECGGY